MKILVDGDVVLYRCGFAAQKTRYNVWTEDEQLVETCENAADANAIIEDYKPIDLHKTSFLEVEPVENALHSVKRMMQATSQYSRYHECLLTDNAIGMERTGRRDDRILIGFLPELSRGSHTCLSPKVPLPPRVHLRHYS